jgi:hypothetical protein
MGNTINTALQNLSSITTPPSGVAAISFSGGGGGGGGAGGGGGGSSTGGGRGGSVMGGKMPGNLSSKAQLSPTKINEVPYQYIFSLTNADGHEIHLTKSAIKGFNFVENIFQPFISEAFIIISDPLSYIENNYLTRGDGRDLMKIVLKPDGAPPEEVIEFEFILGDEVAIVNANVATANLKKYLLVDKNYQLLNETIPYGVKFNGPVGDIIKNILKDKLGEDVIGEFEPGNHIIDINPEFIIPPISYKYTDLIYYLLKIYYYLDEELPVRGILYYDRKKKKFNLQPLSKGFFTKNKELARESFGLGALTEGVKANTNNPPPEKAKFTTQTGGIKSYAFTTPLASHTNTHFCNALVNGYDPILGEHVITQVRISDIKDEWKKKFVDVFSSLGGKPKPFLVLNKHKKKNYFKTYNSPFLPDKNANIIKAEMTNALTFYNLQIIFNVIGNTKRTAGEFIDIFKGKDEKEKVDGKILGRWFVTSVNHQFLYEIYRNEVMAIKTYVGPDTKINDDVD